jgi:hypothetical protein
VSASQDRQSFGGYWELALLALRRTVKHDAQVEERKYDISNLKLLFLLR